MPAAALWPRPTSFFRELLLADALGPGLASVTICPRQAIILETFHYAEEKHA